MTRRPRTRLQYARAVDSLEREAERLLWRYVVEVVERFGLCPWARGARERGDVHVEVLTGEPKLAAIVEAAVRIADRAVLGMIVMPRASLDPVALRRLRDDLVVVRSHLAPALGIADFHPAAEVDLSTAARAIPGLRRSPDPTLQLVRLDALAAARGAPKNPTRADQAAVLAGLGRPARLPTSEQIAADNLCVARDDFAALEQAIAAIHADRDATYARMLRETSRRRA
jgi:hypothetical protein